MSGTIQLIRGCDVDSRRDPACSHIPGLFPLDVVKDIVDGTNLVPRVSPLPAPRGGEKRDPGNEVVHPSVTWSVEFSDMKQPTYYTLLRQTFIYIFCFNLATCFSPAFLLETCSLFCDFSPDLSL